MIPTRDAAIAITICIPVPAPSAIASITLALLPLLSIFTSVIDCTGSVCGSNIFATRILPTGTSALAIRRYSIGIPSAWYPPRMDTDILPIPDTRITNISLSVRFPIYLLTRIGLSVWPKNMLATATKLSTSVVPISFPTALPIHFTTNPRIPR